jgi:hypothetical protein
MSYFDREAFALVAPHAGGRRRVKRSAPRKTATHAPGRSAGATPFDAE